MSPDSYQEPEKYRCRWGSCKEEFNKQLELWTHVNTHLTNMRSRVVHLIDEQGKPVIPKPKNKPIPPLSQPGPLQATASPIQNPQLQSPTSINFNHQLPFQQGSGLNDQVLMRPPLNGQTYPPFNAPLFHYTQQAQLAGNFQPGVSNFARQIPLQRQQLSYPPMPNSSHNKTTQRPSLSHYTGAIPSTNTNSINPVTQRQFNSRTTNSTPRVPSNFHSQLPNSTNQPAPHIIQNVTNQTVPHLAQNITSQTAPHVAQNPQNVSSNTRLGNASTSIASTSSTSIAVRPSQPHDSFQTSAIIPRNEASSSSSSSHKEGRLCEICNSRDVG
ncbi:hypothetical protein G9A89_014833 [Geosiphon pyriformis]|nr:hypothetical protein G9A89_014833 [Geosiphon pyriformis]